MVCYEADARFCHRNLIAQRAHSLDSALQAVHLPSKQRQLQTYSRL